MTNPSKPTYHGSGVYKAAGKYVAICNNMNFDGHYIKEFEIPVSDPPIYNPASWYFLNVVDFSACLEAVYPKAIFEEMMGIKPVITAEKFKQATGHEPTNDDLGRCNCQIKGFGHDRCGWCDVHDQPRFICLCRKPS